MCCNAHMLNNQHDLDVDYLVTSFPVETPIRHQLKHVLVDCWAQQSRVALNQVINHLLRD